MSMATISQKGWIVIPAALRAKYDLHPGHQVQVVDYGGVLAILPAFANPEKDGHGLLQGKTSLTKALLTERKRERTREK